jgi:hypothetical protein
MTFVRSAVFTALALLPASGALTLTRSSAAATQTASSSGSAVEASFTLDGVKASLPKADKVVAAGKAPPAYNVAPPMTASYSKSGTFDGAITLTGTGTDFAVTAASAGTNAAQGLEVHSTASVGSLKVTISSAAGPVFTATLSNLSTNASLSKTKDGVASINIGAGIGSILVNAPTLGIKNKKFSGNTKPNTVLYQKIDPSTKQVVVSVIVFEALTTPAAGAPQTVAVSALALHIKNFKYLGHTVSGDVTIATSIAK